MGKKPVISFDALSLLDESVESLRANISNHLNSVSTMTSDFSVKLPNVQEVMNPALRSFSDNIQEIQKIYSNGSASSLIKQLQESMADIHQFQQLTVGNVVAQITKQLGDSRQIFTNENFAILEQLSAPLNEVDWGTLDSLQDDDEIPEEIQAPVQKIVESVPSLATVYAHKQLTRGDVIGILGLILTIFFACFGGPRDWYQDAQNAKKEEQSQLFEQNMLEFFQGVLESSQGTFENTQRIVDILESGNVIVLDDGQALREVKESDVKSDNDNQNGQTGK